MFYFTLIAGLNIGLRLRLSGFATRDLLIRRCAWRM